MRVTPEESAWISARPVAGRGDAAQREGEFFGLEGAADGEFGGGEGGEKVDGGGFAREGEIDGELGAMRRLEEEAGSPMLWGEHGR